MSDYNKILTLEAQKQWELTKGNLRASVSIVGATYGGLTYNMNTGATKYEVFNELVEHFIKDVEGNEYFVPPESE